MPPTAAKTAANLSVISHCIHVSLKTVRIKQKSCSMLRALLASDEGGNYLREGLSAQFSLAAHWRSLLLLQP